MTATVIIDQADLRRITWLLDRLAKLTGRLKPVLEEIDSALETSVSMRFEHSQGPGGTPWKPSKRVLQFGGKTLIGKAPGRLVHSFEKVISDDEAGVGTNVIYAASHQFGDTGRHARTANNKKAKQSGRVAVFSYKANLPARPFLGFDAVDRRRVEKIVIDALDRVLAGRPA